MVSVQADCSLPDAIALMKARAEGVGCTLESIANAIVAREMRFTPKLPRGVRGQLAGC